MKRITAILFPISMVAIFLGALEVSLPYISKDTIIIFGFCGGIVSMLVNMLNPRSSKHNVTFTIIYWLASIIVLIGLFFRMMHWPYGSILLLSGLILFIVSFIIPRKNENAEDENAPLDQF